MFQVVLIVLKVALELGSACVGFPFLPSLTNSQDVSPSSPSSSRKVHCGPVQPPGTNEADAKEDEVVLEVPKRRPRAVLGHGYLLRHQFDAANEVVQGNPCGVE